MTQFKGEEQYIPHGVNLVYPVLSDLRTLDELKDDPIYEKIQDIRFERDVCYLSLSPLGEFCLQVVGRKEFEQVSLMGDESLPFKLYFYINMSAEGENRTKVQLIVEADLSAILRMIAGPSINDFLAKATEVISNIDYIKLNTNAQCV